ncbi:Neuroblast differentiation-associated protein [Beauveria brongniartii RCEF 3172]|uniref:Neuroblast differentiation-associated protein n=1 Tax=Beauveria brongniartii RCEF 3172 TaxID=1081107 RepID=A0A167II03_9HYPO|nr:Neuroblast differentiation-associated protein [Beauveria brongniartii RCEF 3172]
MSSLAMSNEIHDPPVDYEVLSLRVQEQIRRKFLPLCTEDEKQQVQTTLMPMVYFAPSTVSTPSQHILVNARMDHCPQLLRWALTCFVYGMEKIEAAKKNGEYVRANREQLARFQLDRGPCIPLPKPRLRSRMTGQKRRASDSQSGDADDEDDVQRRVKSKTSLTQSSILDSETKKRVREAANESRLMERKSANGSSEAALDSREASVVQREADLERTLSTRQTASDSRSANLGHSETAINHRLEALKTKETELNNREVVLETRSTELNNLEAAMDTRATELHNREAALNTRGSELNNREVVLETRSTELNNLEAAIYTRNTELNNREAAMDIRDVKPKNRGTVPRSYEADLGHCEVVTNGPRADLASCETALESHEIGKDDGEAILEIRETDLNNLEAGLHSNEAHLGKQESDADDRMATSVLGASQPDNAHKREKDENSATPQAQTGPRFDDNYIEEYQKCYNRAILDIMLLRGLGDAERRTIQDEKFRDALMEEFKQRTESLADATDSAWRIFGYLYRS